MANYKNYHLEIDAVDNMSIATDHAKAISGLIGKGLDSKIRFKGPDSKLSVELKNIILLNGKMAQKFSKIGDGSIITLFDKTPYPENENDVVCPHFIEFKWANGCNFDCSWCYLNGTLRFRPMGKKPYIKDLEKIKGHLEDYLLQNPEPTVVTK